MRIRSPQLENDKIYYDSFIFGVEGSGQSFPISTGHLTGSATQRAPMVFLNWNTYFGPRCRWEVFTQDMSFWVDNLSFPTLADCADWINANAPGASEGVLRNTLVIRPYDIVDYAMPMITKLYGYNRIFHALKGSMRYQAKPKLENGSVSRTIYQSKWSGLLDSDTNSNWIYSCYNELFFTDMSAHYTNPDIKDTFWLPQNHRSIYGTLRNGDPINITNVGSGNGLRKCYNATTGSLVEAPAGQYRVSEPRVCIMKGNAPTAWEFRDPSSYSIGVRVTRDNDYSLLFVYPVNRTYNGDTLMSFFVKPWGVDRLLLNYFDSNRFKLDMITRTGDRILKIEEVSNMSHNYHKDQTALSLPTWNPTNQRAKTTGEILHRDVSFRLRDTDTNRVSQESVGRLVPLVRTRYARSHRWMVISK